MYQIKKERTGCRSIKNYIILKILSTATIKQENSQEEKFVATGTVEGGSREKQEKQGYNDNAHTTKAAQT